LQRHTHHFRREAGWQSDGDSGLGGDGGLGGSSGLGGDNRLAVTAG
jgi:hypothetical protein